MIEIERADAFAMWAHGSIDHRRKYIGTPYIEHPRAVAGLVGAAGMGATAVIVALLHDVVEDTPFTIEMIRREFGSEVADRVSILTDEAPTPGRNRAVRKAATVSRLADADRIVQSVKLADLIDNTATIVDHDPKFARVYLAETNVLIGAMVRGERSLQERAKRTYEEACDKLRA